MSNTHSIAIVVRGIQDDVIRNYCQIIIEHVDSFLSRSTETRPVWTYRTLSKWVNTSADDDRLLRSVSLLSSSLAPLLERHYLWISEEDDGMQRVDDDFVRSALTNNVAEDPDTGELVGNPREHLVPYFAPSSTGAKRG